MSIRLTSLAIALAVATGCGAQAAPHSGPPAPVSDPAGVLHLKPGHYAFRLAGDVRVGEPIRCFTRSGKQAGGGAVQPRGRGVGSSTGFEAMTSTDGRVRITCPANPGNA
jgi:hypothetical protein